MPASPRAFRDLHPQRHTKLHKETTDEWDEHGSLFICVYPCSFVVDGLCSFCLKMKRELRLRLKCVEPPALPNDGMVEFGVQDKKQMLHAGSHLPDGALQFDFAVIVQVNDAVKFSGPFAHGTADAPFVYLSLRPTQAGAAWIKRIKVPLKNITPALVNKAIDADKPLQASVSGQGAATVPLLKAWSIEV
jgi:hypothetical protein